MSRPILAYISKEGCPACSGFESEWHNIVKQLEDKVDIVMFTMTHGNPMVPPCVMKYASWAPSIVLFHPGQYYECFTKKGNKASEKCMSSVVKGIKYNAVEANGSYEYAYRQNTAEEIIPWVTSNIDLVMKL